MEVSSEDVRHLSKVAPEIISWVVGMGAFLLVTISGFAWFFVRKVFSMKDEQYQEQIRSLGDELRNMRLTISEERAVALKREEMYRHLNDDIKNFQERSSNLQENMHGLQTNLKVVQERIIDFGSLQTDVKSMTIGLAKVETSVVHMQRTVESNFGKVTVR